MAQQTAAVVENNFTKGLVTEFTGLNFPTNAATDCGNVTFTLVGNVIRRGGHNYENNAVFNTPVNITLAKSEYKWNNVGGDGNTQILVEQMGGIIYFYRSSTATLSSPLSSQLLGSTVNLNSFVASGGSFDATVECQFTDGNGYLFIYHPSCDPVYCTYNAGTITGNRINVRIRDLSGIPDNLPANTRPTSLSTEHNYNLINQGWVSGNPWSTTSSSTVVIGLGSKTFVVSAGLAVTLGDQVTIISNSGGLGGPTGPLMSGNVTAYAGTSMTVNVTSGAAGWFGTSGNDWTIVPRDTAYISNWFSAVGNYPSNSDVWWYFKNPSGVFDPGATLNNVSLGAGTGPRGHFILDAFSQQRSVVSNLAITSIQTLKRPRTGTWFQGRIWYTGVDAQQPATGNVPYTTWSENIYFSQVITSPDQFGQCYQVNDPTSQTLLDLLPTDGGVITIQGIGSIYKLWPIQNGLLVFGANGVRFITGSQGIGFSANDYTILNISDVKIISSTSFVNVLGLPYFWNEEGIYALQSKEGAGGFSVVSQTYSTIDTLYSEIPLLSKKYARGDYDPINYTIKWIYRDVNETDVGSRYEFNKILNYNTANKAFYPYSISNTTNRIAGIKYITHPGGTTAPSPGFKFFTVKGGNTVSFSEENDFDAYLDWTNIEFDSYFITGYQLAGKGFTKFQPVYVYVFSNNDKPTSYKIQSIWDYANNPDSGRWSTAQLTNINAPNYGMVFKKHKLRGHGLVLQIKVKSAGGNPFDIMGWSIPYQINAGV